MTDYPKLRLGHYLDKPDTPVEISAPDIAHHTAILAQSGAGKSFLLGRLVEEILLKTRANVAVFDINGDFRRLPEANPSAWPKEREQGDYASETSFSEAWQRTIRTLKWRFTGVSDPSDAGSDELWWPVPWWRQDFRFQASVLGLDWRSDTCEVDLLLRIAAHLNEGGTIKAVAPLAPEVHQLLLHDLADGEVYDAATWRRARQRLYLSLLEISEWPIWWTDAHGSPESLASVKAGDDEHGLFILDLPPTLGRPARLAVVDTLLDGIWRGAVAGWEKASAAPREADARVPSFLLVDEAHHFVPDWQGTPLEERVADAIHRIAAEGRKYGLFLILATQRPAKVRRGLLAECENVCLLRLQSPIDHRTANETWGIPKEYVARTAHLNTGDGLLFGRWVPSATFFGGAMRRTKEGGASLNPKHWARAPESRATDGETNG